MHTNEKDSFFITEWLTAGPSCQKYSININGTQGVSDQLGFEKKLRKTFNPNTQNAAPTKIILKDTAPCGHEWEYYCNEAGNSIFVDKSFFYSNPTLIELDAATVLICDEPMSVGASLFTYATAQIWLNGEKIQSGTPPIYKPIKKSNFTMKLNKGENLLYIKLSDLGIRDARTMFAIQIHNDDVCCAIPNYSDTKCLPDAKNVLNSVCCAQNMLCFESKPEYPCYICHGDKIIKIDDGEQVELPPELNEFYIQIKTPLGKVKRKMQLLDNDRPMYKKTQSSALLQVLETLAKQESELRGSGAYFSAYNVLARFALGKTSQKDIELIKGDLEFINTRGDCADFLISAIIRLMLKHSLDENLRKQIKETFLNFRYWMDEPGNDGMCFWSENHALMFCGSQLILSKIFENDIFTNIAKTGKEIKKTAENRCLEWLDDIESDDFEEFNSATYIPVTVAALLNLVDFAPKEISDRATNLLDRIFVNLCKHVFDGVAVTPQGRVYRDVIVPYEQSVQTLIYLIDSSVPFAKSPVPFVSMFATTKYKFKNDLKDIIHQNYSTHYVTGRTQIYLEKNDSYILTSVSSPAYVKVKTWDNIYSNPNAKKDSYLFTKSMNECFHGTSNFRPGTFGYQQHLWSAALSSECVVFTSHPGFDVDGGGMRPGYWFGNSITPAIKQNKNILGAVYCIPSDNPIKFTHTFWPASKFDEWIYQDNWLIGKAKGGFIGLWCSEEQEAFDGSVLQNCEYRCSSAQVAYVCICEDVKNFDNTEEFMRFCKKTSPSFDNREFILNLNNKEFVKYKKYDDKTQYV